ncbi:MAG: carboxypeptidase regulatory-like domain-containing protein [Bryobacteraceae bacterium]
MIKPRFCALVFALTSVSGLGSSLYAQAVSNASITGHVTDEQNAALPGAQVKLRGAENGVVHNAVSNAEGIFTIPGVAIGLYTLEATLSGFQTYVQSGLNLRVGDDVQLNIQMKVGSVAERIEVSASSSVLQTQQNTISQVVDQRRIVELPLNGRDPTELITISGAALNKSDGTNTGSKSLYNSQSISIAGGAGNTTNYLLDGGDNNDPFTNVNMPLPFPDALAEFSVETSTLPARYGIHPGGVVNAVTKSGSNAWHGSVFEFIRNGNANAINYFAPRQDSLKRNQFGGTFGGRIIRDKLFFFGGYQGSRIRQDPSSSSSFVPTADALAGNFSALDGAGCQSNKQPRAILDPSTRQPFPGAQVPVSLFDPASVALSKYLPKTADPCGRVSWGIPVQSNDHQYITRVDWNISPRHQVYGRYMRDDYTLKAFFLPDNILVTSTTGNVEHAQTFVIADNFTVSPTMVNSLRFTIGRRTNDRGTHPDGINATKIGVKNMYQGTPNFLQLAVNNGGFAIGCGTCALGSFPITSYQLANDVDVLKGKHQIAFGVDILRTRDGQDNHYQDNGVFNFNGQYTNDPLLDFMLGKMNSFSQSGQQLNDLEQTIFQLYVQDTYHVTSRLVVNAGLRWEPLLPEYDHFNRGSTFSRAAFDAGTVSTVFAKAPAGSLFYGDPGISKSFTNKRMNNLSPRVGLVFNPDGAGRTTIRAGGAILFDSPGTFVPYRMVAQNPPYGPQVTNTNGPYQFSNPWSAVPGGNPFPLPAPGKNVAFPLANAEVYLPPNLHSPTVYQWNFSIQRRLWNDWVFTTSYLGNKTSHLWLGNETNPAVYGPGATTGNTQARRVLSRANPAVGAYYSSMVTPDDGATANYNGWLSSLEKRFAKNYTMLINYTWSKCLGIGPVTSLGGGIYQDPNNRRGEYGPCTYDVPHLFNASFVYVSKFGNGGWLSRLANNWNLAPLVRYSSGLAVNPTSGRDNSLTGIGNDRPNVNAGAAAYTGATHGLVFQFLNPAVYAQNLAGTFGNAGHNSLRGPGYFNIDLAFSRSIKLTERLTLQPRAEAFNLLNHPNFNGPTANISSSTFGRILSARDPRILQGSLKLSF